MPHRPGFQDTQVQVVFFFTEDALTADLNKALVVNCKDTFFAGGLIFLEQGSLGGPCVGVDGVLGIIIHCGDNLTLMGDEMTTFRPWFDYFKGKLPVGVTLL